MAEVLQRGVACQAIQAKLMTISSATFRTVERQKSFMVPLFVTIDGRPKLGFLLMDSMLYLKVKQLVTLNNIHIVLFLSVLK